MLTLLQNLTLNDPDHELHGRRAEIAWDEHKKEIAFIRPSGSSEFPSNTAIKDLSGKYASPGFFGWGISLTEPGYETRSTLRQTVQSAQVGGFTSLLFYPDSDPPIDTPHLLTASRNAYLPLNAYYSACLTEKMEGKNMTEMGLLARAGAVAFTDGFKPGTGAGILMRAADYGRLFDLPIILLPVNAHIAPAGTANHSPAVTALGLGGIPNLAESLFISQAIQIAEHVSGCAIHFSPVSTAEGVELIRRAKEKGLKITADTALPYLAYTDEIISSFETRYKFLPPLRTETDRQALWAGLEDGTLDFISVHHQPFTPEEKDLEWDDALFGHPNLQNFSELFFQMIIQRYGSEFDMEFIPHHLASGPRGCLGLNTKNIMNNEITVYSWGDSGFRPELLIINGKELFFTE